VWLLAFVGLSAQTSEKLFKKTEAAGVRCDFREPSAIRAAPTPLDNTREREPRG